AQRVADYFSVVEGQLAAGDLLTLLVSLPRDENNVTVARRPERAHQRPAAVELDVEIETVDDIGRNCGGILAARVVRGDECDVGELRDDLSHQRTFVAVTVAARAEHADHPAAAELTRGLERRLERAGRVGVIDKHGEGLTLVDEVEATRHAIDNLDPALDRSFPDSERTRRSGSCERVLDVEAAAQLELDSRELVVGTKGDGIR